MKDTYVKAYSPLMPSLRTKFVLTVVNISF